MSITNGYAGIVGSTQGMLDKDVCEVRGSAGIDRSNALTHVYCIRPLIRPTVLGDNGRDGGRDGDRADSAVLRALPLELVDPQPRRSARLSTQKRSLRPLPVHTVMYLLNAC